MLHRVEGGGPGRRPRAVHHAGTPRRGSLLAGAVVACLRGLCERSVEVTLVMSRLCSAMRSGEGGGPGRRRRAVHYMPASASWHSRTGWPPCRCGRVCQGGLVGSRLTRDRSINFLQREFFASFLHFFTHFTLAAAGALLFLCLAFLPVRSSCASANARSMSRLCSAMRSGEGGGPGRRRRAVHYMPASASWHSRTGWPPCRCGRVCQGGLVGSRLTRDRSINFLQREFFALFCEFFALFYSFLVVGLLAVRSSRASVNARSK